MKKDNEIKISLNLDKVKKNPNKDSGNITKKKDIFNEEELNDINNGKNFEENNDTNYNLDDAIKLLNKHNEKLEEERKPRIGKTYSEAQKEIAHKKQVDLENAVTIKRIITTIIIICAIILIYLFFEYAPIIGIRLPTSNDKNININVVSSDNDIYKVYKDELLIYSNYKISTYNNKGKKNWEYSLDTSFNPNIYIYENYMAVSNNSNGIVYLFNNKKEILNMKVDGKIEHIYMDDNGNMAIEYATNSYKKIIGVYDRKGNNKYNTYLEYTAIIDIKLLDNAKKLLITQADSNSFKVGCSINLLDGTAEEMNLKQILKLDNNFIYNIEKKNNDLILLLDNKVVKYNMDKNEQTELKEFASSQVLFVSLLNKYYTAIEKSLTDNSAYTIVTNDYNNVQISTINIENSPKFVVNSEYLNYCIYQNKLQVMNKWGIEVLSKDLTNAPKNIIIFNDNKSAALIYTNKVEIINL